MNQSRSRNGFGEIPDTNTDLMYLTSSANGLTSTQYIVVASNTNEPAPEDPCKYASHDLSPADSTPYMADTSEIYSKQQDRSGEPSTREQRPFTAAPHRTVGVGCDRSSPQTSSKL